MSLSKEDIQQLTQAAKKWAKGLPQKIKIWFFGSQINGRSTDDSDFDIAIQFSDEIEILDRSFLWDEVQDRWKYDLEKIVRKKVHLVLYEPDQNYKLNDFLNENSILVYDPTKSDLEI